MNNATINVVCYKWKTLANGEHPLMLRVCKDGKAKYQSLGISVNPTHWNFKKNEPKPKCPNFEQIQKIILDKKVEIQKKMLELRADQKEYNATALIIKEEKKHLSTTVSGFYQEIIAQCETENKCGNRLVYLNSYNSLMNFTKNRLDIPFNVIDVPWLERYEKWLRSRGNKENTISLQFRTLRSAYNKAIKEKCAQKSEYPFEEFKVSKFDTSTQKRAIAKTDILKFVDDTEPVGQKRYVQLSKDRWMSELYDLFGVEYKPEQIVKRKIKRLFTDRNVETISLFELLENCDMHVLNSIFLLLDSEKQKEVFDNDFEHLKENLDALRELRNCVEHHQLLIIKPLKKTWSNGEWQTSLQANVQNAINLSPKNARKNLKKLLNSCLVIEESENRSEENTYQLLPAFKVYFENVE